MFVKLAFAVAANLNSQIMIMDEVLAVGDMAFQNKCLAKMRQNADEEGRTILYVSHNMQTIRTLCERCIVMDQGKIIFDGDVEEAISIYMNMGLKDSEVEFDLFRRAFGYKRFHTGLSLRHLSLVDKNSPVYSREEDLQMQLSVFVEKPLKNVVVRTVILNDANVKLGTTWTPSMEFAEPGEYFVDVVIPLTLIEKGTFYTNVGFYIRNDLGWDNLLDQVDKAFRFEITGVPVWNTNVRGYIKLPETVFLYCRKKDE